MAGLIGGSDSKLNAFTLQNKGLDFIINDLGNEGDWDKLYNGLFLLFGIGCKGSNPYNIVNGNQAVVLQILPGNDVYSRQFAFSFWTPHIASRSRIRDADNTYKWSEWKQVI